MATIHVQSLEVFPLHEPNHCAIVEVRFPPTTRRDQQNDHAASTHRSRPVRIPPYPDPMKPTLCRCAALFFACLITASSSPGAAPPDLIIADFESSDYGAWKTTGTAFGPGPARGALPKQMRVEGFLGRGLVNSFFNGDSTTGTLTSPPFKIERPFIQFLIGGGKNPEKLSMHLLVDGQIVRTATGPNDQPGGSEHLDWAQWDVNAWFGRLAVIEIIDQATGGWGHLNIDHLIQTDRKLPGLVANPQREFTVSRPYLNLPVKTGAPKRLLTLTLAGSTVRQFEIELAEAEPDWWAFLDLTPFRGQKAVVSVDKLPENSNGLQAIEQSEAIRGAENLYSEKLRPQFHFTARRGWNNDPNGLVFHQGEYHLFFQHNPYGWNWGNMHWGHAVSGDLVHWREIEEALYPDARGTMFSGSAVVDERNTAGFARGRAKPLVCIYTSAGGTSPLSKGQPFTQDLAFSLDRGRTWTKYDQNPALPHIVGSNRDPKVLWYEPDKKWIMALYLDKNDFALFASADLKRWEKLCDVSLPGTSECPEFFELAVDADKKNARWVFYGGNGRYLIGSFDGRTFIPQSGPHPLQFGNCFYASQTFNGLPARDGRRILMAWGQMNFPAMPFNQMMDFPVELTLRSTADGLRLFANPAREIAALHGRSHRIKRQLLGPDANPFARVRGELLDVAAEISLGQAEEISFNIRGVPIHYDVRKQELTCQSKKAPLPALAGRIRLRFLVDRGSIEIFGNDGQLYMPMGVIVPEENLSLEVRAKGGPATLEHAEVFLLKPAWKARASAAAKR